MQPSWLPTAFRPISISAGPASATSTSLCAASSYSSSSSSTTINTTTTITVSGKPSVQPSWLPTAFRPTSISAGPASATSTSLCAASSYVLLLLLHHHQHHHHRHRLIVLTPFKSQHPHCQLALQLPSLCQGQYQHYLYLYTSN